MQPDNLPAHGEHRSSQHHLEAAADSRTHLATVSEALGSHGESVSSTTHRRPSCASECEAHLGEAAMAAGRRGGTESHRVRPQGGPGNTGLCLSLGQPGVDGSQRQRCSAHTSIQ